MTSHTRSIAEIAYELWESRGRPHGSAEEDWAEAERLASQSSSSQPPESHSPASQSSSSQLSAAVEESLMESFPASDAPASHGADTPPRNADAKWAAAAGAKRSSNKR
jgi:hypothetical protein